MSVLGYSQPGNPKSMTQLDATSPQRTYLIRICKEMISSMDLLRVAGLQGLAAETFLVTRKYSSSTLLLEEIYNYKKGETFLNKNTSREPCLQKLGCSWQRLSLAFYSRVSFTGRRPVTLQT